MDTSFVTLLNTICEFIFKAIPNIEKLFNLIHHFD